MKSPVIDKAELRELKLGSDSTIDRLEAANQFPRRLKLSPGSRRVFWRRVEVEEWLRDRGLALPADTDDGQEGAASAGRSRAFAPLFSRQRASA